MEGHVFLNYMSQDDMSYRSICLKSGHALQKDVLCDVMYCWSGCLQDCMSQMMCLTGRHVLQDDIS